MSLKLEEWKLNISEKMELKEGPGTKAVAINSKGGW